MRCGSTASTPHVQVRRTRSAGLLLSRTQFTTGHYNVQFTTVTARVHRNLHYYIRQYPLYLLTRHWQLTKQFVAFCLITLIVGRLQLSTQHNQTQATVVSKKQLQDQGYTLWGRLGIGFVGKNLECRSLLNVDHLRLDIRK